MSSAQTKYRPSLSLTEIQTIISSLHQTGGNATLIRKLDTFIKKASIGITAPSHVTYSAPKQSLEDSLGFGSDSTSSNQSNESIDSLYTIWQNSPSALSPTQLATVNHYRYINDLMSPEEESKYESGQ